MNEERRILAQSWFRKSEIAFKDGAGLLERASYWSAVNRFYYAAFYSARAPLSLKGLDSSKHSGVISLFHLHFVKTGLIDHPTASALRISFDRHLEGDYGDSVEFTKEETSEIQDQVRRFVNACKKLFKNH